jgi:hypothetical protein
VTSYLDEIARAGALFVAVLVLAGIALRQR